MGRNGSGKTTLFNAILFVLSEKFKRLDQKERQKLCNYRKQSGPFSLYVEVKFDNSDRALPVNKSNIQLFRFAFSFVIICFCSTLQLFSSMSTRFVWNEIWLQRKTSLASMAKYALRKRSNRTFKFVDFTLMKLLLISSNREW